MMDKNRKKQLLWQLPFLTLLVVGTVLIIRQQHSMPFQYNKGMVFGTLYSITYQNDKDLHDEIEAEMKKVDNALSMFNDNSVITSVNQKQTTYIDNSEEGRMFLEVYNLAMKISKETRGAFDITVAPLVNAWGFGFKESAFPSNETIDSLLQFVGYQKQSYFEDKKGKGIRKNDSRMMFDCSAIAKGYGTDVVARLLAKHGVENYMVEIGGEVSTRGINPKRVPWKIGVNKPIEDSLSRNDIQTILNVTDRAMATSGNYRNFYYRGGQKYAHTIDPRTGHPVQHSLLSATVLTDNCATADAYATAFMVMGIDSAKQFLDNHPELLVYFIYARPDGSTDVWYSPSLKDKISE